jgi:hypothetical protein
MIMPFANKIQKHLLSHAALWCFITSTYCFADQKIIPVKISNESFRCIKEMTPAGDFYVDNIAGNLDATLAVAKSETGGVYPPGSVVQLFPNEAMVKHEPGFNPITKDWEFFELDVDENGTTIRKRGFQDVKNRFNGNCFACHIAAEPQWDMICGTGHGCEALPINDLAILALQNTDPRCKAENIAFKQRATAWLIKFLTPL